MTLRPQIDGLTLVRVMSSLMGISEMTKTILDLPISSPMVEVCPMSTPTYGSLL